jgi:hypothetical protein
MNRIKLLTLITFLFFNLNLVFSQAPTSVFFDSGKSDLKPESEAVLKSLVEKILTHADVDLRIEAFTDDKGSESFNQQLAQQRAETVRSYLLSRRIVPQKLDVRPIGELSVDAKEADIEESRRKNRRVDVYFTPIAIGLMSDLATRLEGNSIVTQEIEAGKAATINGIKGVKVELPENAFVMMNGEPCKTPIKVTLKEALKPDDWIFNNLSTVSTNGSIMASGGMFKLEATSNGKPVKFKNGKQARITVPSVQEPDGDMRIFYGARHDSTLKEPIGWRDSQTDWEANNENNNEKKLFIQNLRKRLEVCREKREPFVQKTPDLDSEKLAIALGSKPRPPYTDEPMMPRIRTIENTPIKQSLLFKKRELKKRDNIIAQSEASYPKRLETYKKEKAAYEKEWAEYRKDSVIYVEATNYLAQARSMVYANEKEVLGAMAITDYNSGVRYYPEYEKVLYNKSNYDYWHYDYGYNIPLLRHARQLVGLSYDTNENFLVNTIEKNRQYKAYYQGIVDSLVIAHNVVKVLNELDKEYHKWIDEHVTANVNGLKEYVADVVKLGWVNIDKFYKYDAAKAHPVVMKESDEARVYLVCKQINAILPMGRSKDKTLYGFGKAPSELNFTLVSIKLKDGFPYISVQKVNSATVETLVPDYKKVTVPELKEVLASL